MKKKTKQRRRKRAVLRLTKAREKQVVSQIIRMSRKMIFNDALRQRQIKKGDKLLYEGRSSKNPMLGRGLWLNEHLYQEGYIGTAVRLLDIIRLSDNNAIKDSYIFVSLFCFRHYLELSMKDSIIHYYSDGEASNIISECGHNLLALYDKILLLPNMCEDETTEAVRNMINTIQGYDPMGTTFRYPYKISDNKIMTSLPFPPQLKKIRTLKSRMLQLYNFFDGINSMVHDYENRGVRTSRMTNKAQIIKPKSI